MAFWNWSHNTLGLHVYAIPTLIVAAIAIVMLVVHFRNNKKREDEFETELQKKLNGEAAEGETPAAAAAEQV